MWKEPFQQDEKKYLGRLFVCGNRKYKKEKPESKSLHSN